MRLLAYGVILTGIGLPLLTPQPAHLIRNTECVEFINYRNEIIEEVQELEKIKIEKEIQRQLEEIKRQRIISEKNKPNYNLYNILEPSNLTRDQAYQMLEGTALQSLSRAYVYMEELYGVNAIFLMSLSAEESGYGTSNLARTRNNIGGIKNNDGSWRLFSDWGECLNYKAKLLKDYYLTEDGDYFNGYSIFNINEKYCEQKTWSDNINQIANELLNKLN